jgi:hypothetical protein
MSIYREKRHRLASIDAELKQKTLLNIPLPQVASAASSAAAKAKVLFHQPTLGERA